MLQFLIEDHLQGYNLPSLRTKVTCYDRMEVYIKDGIVMGYDSREGDDLMGILSLSGCSSGDSSKDITRAVGITLYPGYTSILYEDGMVATCGFKDGNGVTDRYEYIH